MVSCICASEMLEVADLAGAPLTTSATSVVKPNATFILDDSGSMDRNFTPEYVNDSEGSGRAAACYDGGSGKVCIR